MVAGDTLFAVVGTTFAGGGVDGFGRGAGGAGVLALSFSGRAPTAGLGGGVVGALRGGGFTGGVGFFASTGVPDEPV